MVEMRSPRPVVLLVAVPWVWAGCTGESAPEVTPGTPRDRLADALALTLCEGAQPCCDELGYGEPTDACQGSMRNAVMASIIAAEDQLRELIPEEHDGCIAVFRSAIETAPTCDDLPAPFELEVRCPSLFSPIPEGEGQPGDGCAGTFDCASPTEPGTRVCLSDGETGGRCVWFVDRVEGAPCTPEAGSIPVCPEGLTCVPDAQGAPVCGAVPGLGESCVLGVTAPCTEGHVCEETQPGEHTCQPELLKGESCVGRPSSCASGLFCNQAFNCQSLVDPCASGDCPALILQNVCR